MDFRAGLLELSPMWFDDLNADQHRETVNTRQRYDALRQASERLAAFRGSMVWSETKGHEYLVRSAYDRSGRRRQSHLGRRTPETERLKAEFDVGRREATERRDNLRVVMTRQASVNRALGLGRVPRLAARIIRMLDAVSILGHGLRVLGTFALYAYEAQAGVRFETALTSTEDIDLLFDARARLAFLGGDEVAEASLLHLLKRVDTSFTRARQSFRAINRDGYMVDLVKPVTVPPWRTEAASIGAVPGDLAAVPIEGLQWLENAPAFEAVVIDDRGEPLRLVTVDPRVFVAHKCWLADRADREALKRRRDASQAAAVGALVTTHLRHLTVDPEELRMLPRGVLRAALPLFNK